MATQDNVGESSALGFLFPLADLQRQYVAFDFAAHWTRSGFVGTPAFIAVVEALAKGDRALADQILRGWGIRR